MNRELIEGVTIYVGLFLSVIAAWLTGHSPLHGLHVIAVFTVRIFMILFALSIHEWSHGAVAYLFGDKTALNSGRLSLNPLKHFDTIGLLVFPGILMALHLPFVIGWAKPVPVVFENMNYRRLGMALTAFAGPFSNFLLAFLLSSFMHICHLNGSENIFTSFVWTFVIMNFVLAFFNLLPLYPMDGGRILVSFLPLKVVNWFSQYESKFSFISIMLLTIIPISLFVFFGKQELSKFSWDFIYLTDILTNARHMSWFSHMSSWMKFK